MSPPVMRFSVLGPVRAWRDDSELRPGPPQQLSLLALLLVNAGHPVSAQEIVNVLWRGAQPDTAVNLVHRYVGGLRRLLEPDLPARGSSRFLVRGSGGYRLVVPPESVDLLRFRKLRGEAMGLAEEGSSGPAAEKLLEALALWNGPAGSGIPDDIRSHPVFTGVDGEQLSAIKLAAEYAPAAGNEIPEALLGLLRQSAARYPLDEVLQARLMTLLAATGKPAAALEVYRAVREALAEDLGLDPGTELSAAHRAVLRQVTVDRAEAPVHPAQLPMDLAVFAGRRRELDELDTLLSKPQAASVVAIGGTAGIGKTALAVRWAHQIADRFPDGQLFADLRGFDPGGKMTSTDEVLRSFLVALGIRYDLIPDGIEAQAALFRSQLAGRRVLIVLDNARDSEHVRPLLPGSSDCVTIVTSRNQLDDLITLHGAAAVTLDLLPYAEATELLVRRLGPDRVAREPTATAEIVKRSGRLPLPLASLSARVAMSQGLSLASLAAELRSSYSSLDVFAGGSPRSDVRSAFDSSYRLLTPAAARLFRLLALHPGPEFSLAGASVLIGGPGSELRRSLAELIRAHLIVQTAPGRFSCGVLLRAYAAEQSLLEDADAAEVRRRLFDHLLHSAYAATRGLFLSHELPPLDPPVPGAAPIRFADAGEAAAWFRAEYAVLIAAIEEIGDPRCQQLATVLEPYVQRVGDPGPGIPPTSGPRGVAAAAALTGRSELGQFSG